MNEINRKKGLSNWLLVLPMVQNGFDLTKRKPFGQYKITIWLIKQIYQLYVPVDLYLQFKIKCLSRKKDLLTFIKKM